MELAALSEVAKELAVSRQGADYHSKQPGFPSPLGKVASAGRIWRMRDVRRYRRALRKREAAKAEEQASNAAPV